MYISRSGKPGNKATLAPSVIITASVEMERGMEGGRLHFLRRFVPYQRQSFAPLFFFFNT